jgi:hypothetical protein
VESNFSRYRQCSIESRAVQVQEVRDILAALAFIDQLSGVLDLLGG